MGINFPATPTVNQLHPDPATVGIPQYKWDGTAWVAVATPEALTYVKRTGDTMTGLLTLSGDPTADLHAVPKRWAAPLDALAYSGMQINGSMEISQELGMVSTSLVNGAPKYFVDGWLGYFVNSTAAFVGQQYNPSGVPGIPNCIFLRSTTAASFSGAGDVAILLSRIEGYRIVKLGWGTASAKPITIGFWVNATVAGTFALSVAGGGTRSYVVDVPITAGAATWEYKTVTIPGDVVGTWLNTNGVGLQLNFCFASGTSLRGAANTWHAANFNATPATTNFFATNNNQVVLTGVVVLPGIYAPTAAQSPLIMRPYDQELMTCKRYYQLIIDPPGAATTNGTAVLYFWSFNLETIMRATPSITLRNNITFGNAAGNCVANSVAGNNSNSQVCNVTLGLTGVYAAGTVTAQKTENGVVADARL